MQFEFATAGRILFGPGKIKEAGAQASQMGKTALVCVGLSPEEAEPLLNSLGKAGVAAHLYQVSGEPTIQSAQEATQLARQQGCEVIIGFGGGSAMDTAKAAAALLNNPGDILDYLEVIGRGKPVTQPSAPCIAIPTTAGTGAEVTRNAVLGAPEQHFKVSLRSPYMLPRLAIVDPELTYQLPPQVTASTGLDALTQLIEPFVSVRANPLTDAIAREGMRRASRSLLKAYEQGEDANARQDMSIASLFGGLALANAALGAVHGFASPLGGMFPGPHGAICARLLPIVMETNIRALQARQPDSQALQRYDEVAKIIIAEPQATALQGAEWVRILVQHLLIPALSEYGLAVEDIPLVVEKASQASSMKGNPIPLNTSELTEILKQAI